MQPARRARPRDQGGARADATLVDAAVAAAVGGAHKLVRVAQRGHQRLQRLARRRAQQMAVEERLGLRHGQRASPVDQPVFEERGGPAAVMVAQEGTRERLTPTDRLAQHRCQLVLDGGHRLAAGRCSSAGGGLVARHGWRRGGGWIQHREHRAQRRARRSHVEGGRAQRAPAAGDERRERGRR